MRTFSLASDVKTPDVTGLETAWLEVRSILCKLCKLDACKFGLEKSSKTQVSILKKISVWNFTLCWNRPIGEAKIGHMTDLIGPIPE